MLRFTRAAVGGGDDTSAAAGGAADGAGAAADSQRVRGVTGRWRWRAGALCGRRSAPAMICCRCALRAIAPCGIESGGGGLGERGRATIGVLWLCGERGEAYGERGDAV